MANRRYEEVPEDWNYEGPQGRNWRGMQARQAAQEGRPGGGYGVGGPGRGYNQGGWGPSSYEEGYEHRSYDRLLDNTRGERDTGSRQDFRGYGPGRDPLEREHGLDRPRALGKAPRGYVRSDERIREDICERLIDSPYDASNVEVQVKDGEVTLVGTVKSRQERRDIEDLALSVRGVHDVHNRVKVAGGGTERTLHS